MPANSALKSPHSCKTLSKLPHCLSPPQLNPLNATRRTQKPTLDKTPNHPRPNRHTTQPAETVTKSPHQSHFNHYLPNGISRQATCGCCRAAPPLCRSDKIKVTRPQVAWSNFPEKPTRQPHAANRHTPSIVRATVWLRETGNRVIEAFFHRFSAPEGLCH